MQNEMNEKYEFRHAVREDADTIFALYRSLAGTPYCAWDENYPTRSNLEEDLAARSIYCLCEGRKIIAVATAMHCPEHDVFPWSSAIRNPCELMRVGVARDRQGCGVGALLLGKMVEASRDAGYDGMRILVSRKNLPAVKLYRNAGAQYRGETTAYGIDWFCYEIVYSEQKSPKGNGPS
ncbi:MAG: Acetyltransferase (GNAT) family protein [Lentisphaerae bacterium ADurb.Bin242]|nr:MAG: Acetyltransferase (GNAT) family protein [Lentisphaerae bacterium ADurb.Bin242]